MSTGSVYNHLERQHNIYNRRSCKPERSIHWNELVEKGNIFVFVMLQKADVHACPTGKRNKYEHLNYYNEKEKIVKFEKELDALDARAASATRRRRRMQ